MYVTYVLIHCYFLVEFGCIIYRFNHIYLHLHTSVTIKTMRIGQVNIRSLAPKINEIRNELTVRNFDLLALTEIWLNGHIPTNSISIDNYSFIRKDRQTSGGGVGLLLNKQLKYSLIPTNDAIEQLWVKVELKRNNFILGVVYRPPQLDYKIFTNGVEDSFEICSSLSDIIYICSDSIFFCEFAVSLNLEQLVDQATRIHNGNVSLLIFM